MSSAGSLGARRLQTVAMRLENHCKEGGSPEVGALVTKLLKTSQETSTCLQAWL